MNGSTSRALVAAAVAFTIALFVFGSAVVRAFVIDDVVVPGSGVDGADADSADATGADRPLSLDALMLAIENDPFHPERTRPPVRYRLPGDVDPPPPPELPPPPPLPDFRVTGTAVTPEGGFAVMQLGDAPPRVLAIGEYLAGYQLARVTAETATMQNEQREITLIVPGPATRPVAVAPPQRPTPQTRQQMSREQAIQQAQLVQQILQRARADGATPQMLQAIERLIAQRGIDNLGNMEVQIQGGTMSIRTRTPPDTSSTSRLPHP
jgi:hypothetical protein